MAEGHKKLNPAVMAALKVLCEAKEDDLMDALEEFRVAHRARLSALMGQSVAEGLDAFKRQGNDASTFDPAALAAALFGELPEVPVSGHDPTATGSGDVQPAHTWGQPDDDDPPVLTSVRSEPVRLDSRAVKVVSFGCGSETADSNGGQQPPGSTPPHQYREQALVKVHGKWQTPDAATREWIQGLPPNTTLPAGSGISEYSRCKMLGNSWHLPSARFILFVLLASCNVIPVTAGPVPEWYTRVEALPWSSNLNPLGARPIERPTENTTQQHLQWALALDSNQLHFSENNPCLKWALQFGQSLGRDLSRWREGIVQDVRSLKEDLQFEQQYWLQSAPQHVQQVYRQGGESLVLQPIVVLHLLTLFEFPGTTEDAKYSRRLSRSQFQSLNAEHKRSLYSDTKPSEHTATMLEEIAKEQLKARFQGPFEPCQVADDQQSRAARAFPLVQQDKVRRADDWRRSHHNSTVCVQDSPPYAGTQSVLNLVQSAAQFGEPTVAALDHDGAYRALPVRDPQECYVFVPNQAEPSVFRHLVLPFGGTGSVWSYLRIADIICFLTITMLFIPAAHFVDDYFYSEPTHTSESAFTSFCLLQALLGFQMKAAHLAGKLNFVCSWVFAGVGKACSLCYSQGPSRYARDVVCFVDNSASEHALKKGYSKDAALTNLLGWFWSWVASRGLNLFFVRVSSKANLSDAASRGDWAPSDSLGCRRCSPDFGKTWGTLQKLTETSVTPDAALFEDLVGLLALPTAAQ
ncbi:unnamed protein product [Symbiodinium sp. CCMP2592]|nr:unnamed protein product [Symbiodinium sp. CCMP2592]